MRPRTHRAPGRCRRALLRHHLRRRRTARAAERTVRLRRIAASATIAVKHRKLDVRSGRARRGHRHGRARRLGADRLAAGQPRTAAGSRSTATRTDAAGRYHLRERLRRTGRRACASASRPRRASRRGRAPDRRASTSTAAPTRRGTGPASTATRTACGGTLTAGRLGVAHKSLPCGTKVTFQHGGRTVRVPVIDRGPVRRRARVRPDRRHRAAPRLRGPRRDAHHPLDAAASSCGRAAAAGRPRPPPCRLVLERRHRARRAAARGAAARRRAAARARPRVTVAASLTGPAACARGSPWSSRRAAP